MLHRSIWLFTGFLAALVALPVSAHELWVLTPDQVLEWQSRAKPDTFTQLTFASMSVLGIALLINLALVHLNENGANELFPVFRARLHSCRHLTSLVLRFCMAWVLISSSFALEPRFGNAMLTVPTLLAPDLSIRDLPLHWQWLRWAQLSLGLMLLFGVYVRVAAVGVMALAVFSLALMGLPVLAYLPCVVGVCLYLFFAGPGAVFFPIPAPAVARKLSKRLEEHVNLSRAQFVLRVLAGANFLYLAVYFKVFQPNLILAIIDVYDLPIFGFDPEVFALIMATVEVSIGALILANILLRFLSVVLLLAFLFFAFCLSEAETITSHMLYYGVALSFLFNGGGRWITAAASDQKKRIVVLGGGVAAVAACTRLERLLPDQTNVELILVNERLEYQFTALFPEVVSGAVQPSTLVNPFSRTLNRTQILQASVKFIDTDHRKLILTRMDGREEHCDYDELLYARNPVSDTQLLHPKNHQQIHHLQTIGDALALRRRIVEKISVLKSTKQFDPAEKDLNFKLAIVGGGQRGSALAVEVQRFLTSLKFDSLVPDSLNTHIVLFEDGVSDTTYLSDQIKGMRARYFSKHGIRIVDTGAIHGICDEGIELKQSGLLSLDVVVNLQFCDRSDELPSVVSGELFHDSTLQRSGCSHVWMASQSAHQRSNPQRSLPRIVAQADLAAINAWASSQGYALQKLEERQRCCFEFYMGRATIATLFGLPIPSFVAWHMNRWRFLSLLPSVERKLRIAFDWVLDLIFLNDTAVISEDRTQVQFDNSTRREEPTLQPQPHAVGLKSQTFIRPEIREQKAS